MEAVAKYKSGWRFDVEARGHVVVSDQPLDNGGLDQGMTPPEFLLASLASCAGYYAAQYLKTRLLPVEGMSVRVSAEKATQPARLGAFHIEVTAPLTEERHQLGLLRAVKACLIHNTLLGNPDIDVHLLPVLPQVQSVLVTALEPANGNGISAAPVEWRV